MFLMRIFHKGKITSDKCCKVKDKDELKCRIHEGNIGEPIMFELPSVIKKIKISHNMERREYFEEMQYLHNSLLKIFLNSFTSYNAY